MLRPNHAALCAALALSAACAKHADDSASTDSASAAPAVAAIPLTGDSAAPAAATPPAAAESAATPTSAPAAARTDSSRSKSAATAPSSSTHPAAATARSTAPVSAGSGASAAKAAPAKAAPAVAVTRSTSPVVATASTAGAKGAPATPTPAAAAQGAPVKVNQFMSYDAAAKTVNLQVTAALTSQRGGFNFNGGSDGSQTITVPQGWTVRMHVKNVDAIPHSAILILDQKPLPNSPETPAISRAYTSHVSDGLPAQTGQDDVEFRASKVGNFLIYCGVPGHGPSGMYIRFVVSADATTPSYSM